MTGTTGQVALSPDKERQILNGAAEVFAQDGYEGASMSRIALAANVSKGTLYNYFTSKAHLFSAHVATMCAEHLAIVFNDLTPEQEIRHTLQMIGTRMLAMFCAEEGLAIFRVIISEAPKFPELAQAFFMAGPAVVPPIWVNWNFDCSAVGGGPRLVTYYIWIIISIYWRHGQKRRRVW